MTQHAHAKINIFLKITGKRENYHTMISRFVKVPHLYDTVHFVEASTNTFVLEGPFDGPLEKNTIYKAYQALLEATKCQAIVRFFNAHKVVVEKRIPVFSGLGGGSSDAATFMLMANELCGLGLDMETLASIGARIGADVPFFIYGYESANVTGIGEIVTPFDEEVPLIKTVTPSGIGCETPAVFGEYRKHFFDPIDEKNRMIFATMRSQEALETLTIAEANDLYKPACALYPGLEAYARPGYFFSGSGSTFFTKADHG